MNKEDAIGRLAYEHPNNQLCILNQDMLLHYLHFIGVEEIKAEGGEHVS